VNFVVTDGGSNKPDGADANSGDASGASAVTDVDAQVEDAGMPAFITGAPVTGPARYVQYKCCTPANDCFIAFQGDDLICRDMDTWATYAALDCQNQGLVVNGLAIYVGC
jgi:hypothetical protein